MQQRLALEAAGGRDDDRTFAAPGIRLLNVTTESTAAQASETHGEHPLPASFRDPAGFVFVREGEPYRQVNMAGAEAYDQLMASGLYAELVARGWLVSHAEVDPKPGTHRILKPQRICFVSYPYEWSFSQLKDAALLTLDAQLAAIEHGMSLKDASAYNVQFHGGKPVLIDTLSFEAYDEGRPWVAYRQFCQHFLAPLALMAHVDIRLSQLLRANIDGIPLDLASRLLPYSTRARLGLAMHIHLHARSQRAYAPTDDAGERAAQARSQVRVSRRGLQGLLDSLRGTVAKLAWKPAGTEWGDYYQATNYDDAAFDDKQRLVAEYIAMAAPRSVWDLGANTGVFSRIASRAGADTVAFDIDPAAVERNYRQSRSETGKQPLPLLLDLTNPSPGLGWAGTERDSLAARGPVDCAMALALIHHIAISNNVPLARVADYLASLCRHLVIEFVPKEDSQAQRLLSSREDIFGDYDRTGFEAAFSTRFRILRAEPVRGTHRTMYLMAAN
jgi:ribosomal protein L11 methylase PrmA